MIQYGFVVFFVAGFPLAPVLALINNLVELRVDAYKITNHFRRPIPKKVPGIGAWMGILQAMTYVGVVTNVRKIIRKYFVESRNGLGLGLSSIKSTLVLNFEALENFKPTGISLLNNLTFRVFIHSTKLSLILSVFFVLVVLCVSVNHQNF